MKQINDTKKADIKRDLIWAVTGTFHGSIIFAQSEGEARRIFHKHYNGESIIHMKNLWPHNIGNL